MTIQVVTYLDTLFKLAHELGKARKSGDKEAIEKANEAHEAYRKICLDSKTKMISKI